MGIYLCLLDGELERYLILHFDIVSRTSIYFRSVISGSLYLIIFCGRNGDLILIRESLIYLSIHPSTHLSVHYMESTLDRPNLHSTLSALHQHRHITHGIPLPLHPETTLPLPSSSIIKQSMEERHKLPIPPTATNRTLTSSLSMLSPIKLENSISQPETHPQNRREGEDVGMSSTPIDRQVIRSNEAEDDISPPSGGGTVHHPFHPQGERDGQDMDLEIQSKMESETSVDSPADISGKDGTQIDTEANTNMGVDISSLLLDVFSAGNEEWLTWKFSDEEQARRKAYLPKP